MDAARRPDRPSGFAIHTEASRIDRASMREWDNLSFEVRSCLSRGLVAGRENPFFGVNGFPALGGDLALGVSIKGADCAYMREWNAIPPSGTEHLQHRPGHLHPAPKFPTLGFKR